MGDAAMSMRGRVAVITGGGSGIGAAAGRAFAAAGAHVVLADVSEAGLAATRTTIETSGGEATSVVCDVADEAAVAGMVDEVMRGLGRIDSLYNNAGGPLPVDGDLTEIDSAAWAEAMRVDLFGTIICSRLVIPHMQAAGSGSIVNTTSIVALRGVARRDAYVAAKGAVIALTKSMAAEFAEFGIRVNAVAPGVTRSDRVVKALAEDSRTKALVDRHLLGLVDPEDVAAAALFLAGDAARRITGQVLAVDSGATQILTSQR